MSYVDSLYWVPCGDVIVRELKSQLTLTKRGNKLFDPNAADERIPMWDSRGGYIGTPVSWGFQKYGNPSEDRRTLGTLSVESQFSFTGTLGCHPGRELQSYFVENTCKHLRGNLSNGTISQAPPGYGKTVLGAAISAEMGVKTMIVVHKEFLRDQWIKSFSEFTDLRSDQIGIVQSSTEDWEDKPVVICMIQSLLSREYSPEFWESFGLVILDECHRVGSPLWSSLAKKIPAKYRLGLTATPRRKDGLLKAFLWSLGMVDTVVRADLITPQIYHLQVPQFCPLIKTRQGKPMASKMLSLLLGTTSTSVPGRKTRQTISAPNTGSNKRDQIIVREIAQALKSDRKILILSDRIPHLERMGESLKAYGSWSQDFYIGGRSKSERKIAEKAQCIWATYAMAQEGLDIVEIDTVVLSSPKSDVEQTVGRAMRPHEGKKQVLVIDIADDVPPFRNMSHRRLKFYNSKNWKVTRLSRGQ
jgi:superfamily II DNA or RNA helicase